MINNFISFQIAYFFDVVEEIGSIAELLNSCGPIIRPIPLESLKAIKPTQPLSQLLSKLP